MLVFILSAAAILFSPGPTNALLCVVGASRGVAASVRFIAGAAIGYVISISVLQAAGSAVIEAVPAIGTIVRLALAGYLVFLALQVWRSGVISITDGARSVTFRQMMIATLLNPKCFLFAFAVFPAWTTLSDELSYLALFIVIMAAGALSWVIVGATIGRATHAPGRKIFHRCAATVLGVLAVFIVASIR